MAQVLERDCVALVDGIRSANPSAFLRLIESFGDALLNHADRIVGDLSDAEEVVQDTFEKARRAIEKGNLREPLALHGWLTTICQRECFRLLQRRRRRTPALVVEDRRQFTEAEEAGIASRVGPAAPEQAATGRETERELLAAVASIPGEKPRRATELALLGFSYEEIGRLLGARKAGNVKVWVARGRRWVAREWRA